MELTISRSIEYRRGALHMITFIHRQSVMYCSTYKDKAWRTCVLCHWRDSLELTIV